MRILVFAFACLAALPARAETTRVDAAGTSITLEIPGGFCTLDRGQPVDSQMLTNIERAVSTSNTVLVVFAKCDQLGEMRSGGRTVLDDFGSYMMPIRGYVQTMPPVQFAKLMEDVFKKRGAAIMKGVEPQIRQHIDTLKLGVKVGEQKMIGVLRTDDRASYIGVIQNLGLPNGTSKVQLALIATGLTKNRIIALNLYTRYGEGNDASETTLRTLDLAAKTYGAMAQANGQ